MPRPHAVVRSRHRAPLAVAASLAIAALLPIASPAPATADALPMATESGTTPAAGNWAWPAHPSRVERPFIAPPHRYGAGHRGIDLRPLDGDPVMAPARGVIAFAGEVAGRGVLTIDHGNGIVTTLEPVESELPPGTVVERGALVGRLSTGGHAAPGVLHFGVRRDGEYLNPLQLLGGVPRAVLLPCC